MLLITNIVILSHRSFSQDNYYDDYFNLPHHTETPSFTSPEVAGLGKYIDIPVSLYTGVPKISIPLYQIKVNDFILPISLSYHSSGIKVEEVASWVGLGWTLNAGGVITRAVKGIPDDLYEVENIQNEYGADIFCFDAGYLYSGEIISDYCNETGSLSGQQFWKLSHGGLDGEPDIFYFNFFGYTGKFVFDHDGSIHLFEKNNLEISYSKESQGFIDEFVIRTGNGVKVTFAAIEMPSIINGGKTDDLFYFALVDVFHIKTHPTAWYISQIELPNSNEIITFEYENEDISTIKRNRQEFFKSEDYYPYWNSLFNNDAYYFQSSKRLSKIVWNNGAIEFEANHLRQDYDLITTGQNVSNPSMESKALTGLKVIDKNDNQILSYIFNYSYFYTTTIDDDLPCYHIGYSKRLKLDNIYQESINGLQNGTYFFEYDNTPMPHRFSYEQDYWGYYNANHTNGTNPDKTLIPNFYEYSWDGGINDEYNNKYLGPFSIFQRSNSSSSIYFNDFADRSPNPDVIQACMLKKIIYPTGGSHEFIYEPNEFYLDGQNIVGGGVRIKKSIANDYLNPEKNIIKEYYYTNVDDPSISSGRVIYLPQFVKGRRLDPLAQSKHTVFSISQGGLGSTHGSIVGYEEVMVKQTGNGTKYFKYNLPATFGEETANCDDGNNCIYNRTISERFSQWGLNPTVVESNFPFPPDPNYDWNRGQLIEEKIFNESDVLLKHTTNEYQIHEYNKINSLFVKDLYWECIGSCSYSFKYGKYYYLSTWQTPWKKTETTYDNNGETGITISTEYIYDNPAHKLITEKRRNKSDGSIDIVEYQYPEDISNPAEVFTSASIINKMIVRHMVNPILKAERFNDTKRVAGGINTFNYYNFNFDIPRPSKNYVLEGEDYKLESNIGDYDNRGNPLQFHKENNIISAYYWGYNYQYPIIQADNILYDELKTSINTIQPDIETFLENLGNLSEESQRVNLKAFNTALRAALPNAMITSYTYNPLIGMSSETNPSGKTTYYYYDSISRLETIKDNDDNIIKHLDYNYFEPFITVSPKTISLSSNAGTVHVDILSNVNWEISENSNWIGGIIPSSLQGSGNGYFSFNYTAYNELCRSTEITISTYFIDETISITQFGNNECEFVNVISPNLGYNNPAISEADLQSSCNDVITMQFIKLSNSNNITSVQIGDLYYYDINNYEIYTIEVPFGESLIHCKIISEGGLDDYVELEILAVQNPNTVIGTENKLTLSNPHIE